MTPSQTVGPFLSIGLAWEDRGAGDVRVGGVVYDGAGEPVPDAMVETWSPEPAAYARSLTDEAGRWEVAAPAVAYLAVHVFARGLLDHLTTRICFDESAIPDGVPAERRETLVARPDGDGAYRFDVRLQGPGETVFFG